jgi:hypothetical protein
MLFSTLGILSAIIFLAGDAPYLIDTIRAGRTKPHRVSWGIAFLSNAISFANQWASGATNSLWLFGAATIMVGAIFLASLKNGTGGHSKNDVIATGICLIGLCLWVSFNSPLFSIFANLGVSVIALMPTIAKAKIHPKTETRIAWLMGMISSLMATASVGKLDVKLLILPGAGVLLEGYMVYILYFRDNKKARLRIP